jgi:hypothetical protein
VIITSGDGRGITRVEIGKNPEHRLASDANRPGMRRPNARDGEFRPVESLAALAAITGQENSFHK